MRTFALALCLLLLAASLWLGAGLFVVLALTDPAHAATCFADAQGVRHVNPQAWPSWTRRMEGHRGEKCWIATKVRSASTDAPESQGKQGTERRVERRRPLAPHGHIPVPRPRLTDASIPDPAPEASFETDRLQEALRRAGQRLNFEERFNAAGGK